MATATRTYLQLRQEVARRLNAYENGTLTAVAVNSATCASYPFKTALTNADSNKYVGDEIYFTDGQFTPLANQIITYAPTTGAFTPGLNWTDGGTDPTTFDIYRKGITTDMLGVAVNRALRKMRYASLVPLSILADADCDESGVTSWGTASNVTATKVITAGNVNRGMRALRTLCTSANGYLPTAAHAVRSNRAYYVQADVRAAVGTAKLIAWDSTNGAEIDSATYTYQGWGRLYFTFTTPATCESLTLRLGGVGAADDAYWDDVMLYPADATEISLPSYITNPGQVRYVKYGFADAEHDTNALQDYYWFKVSNDWSNPLNQFKLTLYPATRSGPIWLEVSRVPAALSADADTCFLDRDWVELAAEVELLDMLVNRQPGQEAVAWKIELGRKQKELRHMSARFMPGPIIRSGFSTPPTTVGAR